MSWQDIVIALCQLAFLPSMLPTIFGNDKPALSTSILNSIIVTIITATMATLQLWFSVATGTITALIWAVLAFQKLNISNRTNKHVGTTSDKNHSNI